MSFAERLARFENSLRPLLSFLPPPLSVRLFSLGRTWFVSKHAQQNPDHRSVHTAILKPVRAWNMDFRIPLWNAAGMFKNGDGYDVVSAQGAGAYVAGTVTSRKRVGNVRNGIALPAVPYARSASASNWLGLPNVGHDVVANRIAQINRVQGCPLGVSVAAEPGLNELEAIPELIRGMFLYEDAGADYLELNESCPNVEERSGIHLDEGLIRRLQAVSDQFLKHRSRALPVVVKFSVDTNPDQLEDLIRMLAEMHFDGIILGNTSTQYSAHRQKIHGRDIPLYDFFTSTYGGGLSGSIIASDSLELCKLAVELVHKVAPSQEFNVIRCGGVMSARDVEEGAEHGIHLNQWYVGYFEAFARLGNDVYTELESLK